MMLGFALCEGQFTKSDALCPSRMILALMAWPFFRRTTQSTTFPGVTSSK
jgi:hypothetical protein